MRRVAGPKSSSARGDVMLTGSGSTSFDGGRDRNAPVALRMRFLLLVTAVLVTACPSLVGGQTIDGQKIEQAVVSGIVRTEAGAPLPGALVEVRVAGEIALGVTTGSGGYRVEVPAGRGRLRVRHVGHASAEMHLVLAAGQVFEVDVALPTDPIRLKPVLVSAAHRGSVADSIAAAGTDLAIAGSRTLESSPGFDQLGLGEALRGMPGGEPTDPTSVLYVRGAPSDLKLVYLDGAPVYAPFPIGGLLEPFSSGLLSSADVYVGGAPARYDGGLSYVMDLRTRASTTPGFHLTGSMDLLSAEVLAQVGMGDRFGVVASIRNLHPLTRSGLFGGALPYDYGEQLVRADLKLGRSAGLSVTGFTNDETVWLTGTTTSDSVIQWGNRAGSARLTAELERTFVELTGAIGHYTAVLPIFGADATSAAAAAHRTRLSADFSRAGDIQLRYGFSIDRQNYEVDARGESVDTALARLENTGTTTGAYVEVAGRVGDRVRIRGGVRTDDHTGTRNLALAPRIAATWLITDRAAMTLAAGVYHQYVRPPDEVLLTNPEIARFDVRRHLQVARASHFVVGIDQEIGDGLRLGIEGYYKDFSDVPGDVTMAANASGVDFWVRRTGEQWNGWLGYSLAWTWSPADPGVYAASFHGRHLLSAGLEAKVRDRTRLGFRFAYGAGLPYAGIPLGLHPPGEIENYFPMPTTRAYSMDRGGTETAPLLYQPPSPFIRVDASISRAWLPDWQGQTVRIEPYFKVLNGLGRRDPLFYLVDHRDPDPAGIGGFPVLPVMGVRIGLPN